MPLGSAGLIQVAQILVLVISGAEDHLLGQGIFAGDCKHLLGHPEILLGELADQGWVSESLLEKHDDWLIVNLRDNVFGSLLFIANKFGDLSL
jgi:hypothetical protein